MRHIASFLFIGPMLAFGGCSTVPGGLDSAFVTAGEQVVTTIVQKIKDDPSAPFCVANAANRKARLVLGGKARSANQTAGAVTRQLCLALGGKPTAVPPRNAVPASQVTPVASAS